MQPFLDWQFMVTVTPALLRALPVTLELTAVSLVLALALALALALIRVFRVPGLRQAAAVYISFMRGTPLLVQIYLAYYGLPKVLNWLHDVHGWSLDVSGIPAIAFVFLALTLNVAAYSSETFRAAIEAVPAGQLKAALALGFRPGQAMRVIVLPQAFAIALPSLGNTAIALLKDTSLAFLVSVVELMGEAKIQAARGLQFFEVYIVAALVYWVVCIGIEWMLARLELRIRPQERKARTA